MPRIAYLDKVFKQSTLDTIAKADEIATEYQRQGYELTLRQLYYQFVARGLIPNSDKSYNRLGVIVSEARLTGLLDWHHITDRTRYLRHWPGDDDPGSTIINAAQSYERDLWSVTNQPYRPEVWVEKDALVDVVARACGPYRVPHFSCRGYVSQSEMWRAGQRLRLYYQAGLTPVVIHLGDHDPSGLDMTRDITDRLALFTGQPVEVRRVALNLDQVEQYSPPPNPAKVTDARAARYIDQYGHESWELDALEPSVLDRLIRDEVTPYVNQDDWREGVRQDLRDRELMIDMASRWDDISYRWNEIEAILG